MSRGITGKTVTPGTGEGVTLANWVTWLNAASLICLGGAIEDVVVVGDGQFGLVIYLAAGNGVTHDQGTALARAVAERL